MYRLIILIGLISLMLASPAAAVWQYDQYPQGYRPYYGAQPQFPSFTPFENRPSGFGTVRQGSPYPLPNYPNARFCESTQDLGHYSRWTGWWHSGFTGTARLPPRSRLSSGYCPPQTTYHPNRYWWA